MSIDYILKGLSENLEFFSIPKGYNQNDLKRFAEFCIFYGIVRDLLKLLYPTHSTRYKQFIIQQLENFDLSVGFSNYYLLYHLLLPYMAVRKDITIDKYEKVLDFFDPTNFISPEIPPFRKEEWNYYFSTPENCNIHVPLDRAPLSRQIHLTHIDRDLTYAYTHTMFYRSDYGFKPYSELDLGNVDFYAGNLMLRFYYQQDLDLLLELTINYISLAHNEYRPDFNVLNLPMSIIIRNDFIDGKISCESLESKYHTYLVLLMLMFQLLDLVRKGGLHDDDISRINRFLRFGFGQEETAYHYSWACIQDVMNKKMSLNSYYKYLETWGFNQELHKYLRFYWNLLGNLNDAGMLWQREITQHIDMTMKLEEIMQETSDFIRKQDEVFTELEEVFFENQTLVT